MTFKQSCRTGWGRAACVAAAMAVALTVFAPGTSRGSGDTPADRWVRKITGAKDATYTLTYQNRIRGTMRLEETMRVQSRGGAVYLRWLDPPHKDREALIVPGWNGGRVWIKEGGPLSFAAVAVAIDDPMFKSDYQHPLDAFSPARMAERLAAALRDGKARVEDDGKTMQIEDGQGKPLETWTMSDVKLDAGLTAADFAVDNPAFGFPGYAEAGIFIDPEKLTENLNKSWGAVSDYTCILVKKELIQGQMRPENRIRLKFRKPCDIYMKWLNDPNKDRELLYRRGADEKMLVRESGVLGVAAVRLDIDSSLTRRDTTHRVTDLDIGHTIGLIRDNLSRGLREGDVTLQFKGIATIAGRRTYMVESRFENAAAKKYYAARTLAGHDQRTGLPVKLINFDQNGRMFEDFEWNTVRFNAGLADRDFDPANPDYRF